MNRPFGPSAARNAGGALRAASRVATALAVLAGVPGFAFAAGPLGIGVEASYMTDDNVTRAKGSGDALSDAALGVRITKGLPVPVSEHTRAIFQGFAGTEKFHTYTGLSHNFFGAQGEFQYRASGEFGAPTYAAFVRSALDAYESNLRDGYRHAFGVTVLKPATDRIQLSGAFIGNIGDGRSAVFDTRSVSVRANADWSLGRWDVVYLGAEYRRGDSVSTARPTLAVTDTADAIVQDDAFHDAQRFAYRYKAGNWLTTLGYNHAFGEGRSLDLSWRWVQSTPLNPAASASASELSYVVNQFSIAYLARF
ncbi:MAG: hypothetical protein WBM28_12350 [Burkholderiales bacterium]